MMGMLRFGFVGLMTGAVIVMYVSSHLSKTTTYNQKVVQPVQLNDEQHHHGKFLTHPCRMYFPILINWTSPFAILRLLVVFFSF